jgi:hypothetical protein
VGATTVVETEIYADHMQFYVVDAEAEYRADWVWHGKGLERHLGVSPGIVAVGTIGYTSLPVRLEIWDEEPRRDLESWDHVVEATLDVASGRLGLHDVGGPGDLSPIEIAPGTYRVRSAATGLDGADEMEGGDSYRVQLWRAPPQDVEVLKRWHHWDPAHPNPRPTAGGRVVLGAEAHDRRMGMSWLGSRGQAHLFRDADGGLWEHSNLPEAGGTPQLEELGHEEAERRYGPERRWGPPPLATPSFGSLLRNIWRTWRYSRGRRPPPEPMEPIVEDGRRIFHGGTAITQTYGMRWLAASGGDNLYADEGTLWEYRNEDAAAGNPKLTELSRKEAEQRYGPLP